MQSLWDLREQVRQIKPSCPIPLADQLINKHIRAVTKKRSWSDLLKITSLNIPNQTTAGTITTTPGSNIVVGDLVGWPVNDAVSAVLTMPIMQVPGQVQIFPSSMANISQGDWVVIDMENNSITEVVVVRRVSSAYFVAYCKYQHAAGASVQKSSLANQQITMPNNQVATVTAIYPANAGIQNLKMDQVFGGAPIVAGTYFICLRYVRISPTAYRLKDAVDPVAGVQIGTDKTMEWLNRQDPQRTTTGTNPLEFVNMPPNPGGVMQWELWPAQQAEYVIPVFYVDDFPKLVDPEDMSPFFINDEVFVALAQGDALRTKNIVNGKADPYYDPNVAQTFMEQGLTYLEEAIQQDEGRYMTCLQSWQQMVRGATGNTAYESDHLDQWVADYN